MKYAVGWLFAGIVLFLGGWVGPVWALTLSVALRPNVTLLAESLVLGEVAEISYPDVYWEGELRRLDLGYVPAPGEARMIRPQEIFDRVAARRIPGLAFIHFSGAEYSRVVFAGEIIPWSAMSTMIEEELLRLFPFAQAVEIQPLGATEDLTVPPESTLQLFIPSGLKPWGRGTAHFTVSAAGGYEQRESVTFGLKVFRDTVRTIDHLRPGDVIGADQVQVLPEALSAGNDQGFASLNEVIGLEVRRAMRPGEVISPEKVQKETLIERGDLVTMVARNGLVTVTATGRARGNGSLGESIVVENPESRKRVQAQVIGERLVEVEIR